MKNKTILITGATAGFGLATAQRFAKEGARLILTGRRDDRLKKLKAELKTEIHTASFDVRDRTAVEQFINALPPAFAAVDVLVNNAGLALGLEPAHKASMEDWEQMIDTNIKGMIYCTRALLPGMVQRNTGHIVNLGSIAGNYPYPGGNVYGATKSFVKQFSLNLKADLIGTGVRVTNIEPGMADTEFSLVRFHGDANKAKTVYANTVSLTAEDIAECIFWSTSLPAHVNINRMEIMSTHQASGPFAVKRS